MITDYSPEQLTEILNRLGKRYGKLWPLQVFNACNPLASYEDLPFQQALGMAQAEIGFSVEDGLAVFKKLYQKQTLTREHIHSALAKDNSSVLDQVVRVSSSGMTYRELFVEELHQEFGSVSQNNSSPVLASVKVRENIQVLLSNYFAKQPQRLDDRANRNKTCWINEQLTKWLAAYLDDGQALWRMPYQNQSFRQAWWSLVIHDNRLPKPVYSVLKTMGEQLIRPNLSSIEAMAILLKNRNITPEELEPVLTEHLKQMPGWVSYIQYCTERKSSWTELLSDYLLLRLIYDVACDAVPWVEETTQTSSFMPQALYWETRLERLLSADRFQGHTEETLVEDVQVNFEAWTSYLEWGSPLQKLITMMEALEQSQNCSLTLALTEAFSQPSGQTSPTAIRPEVQAVFCIDVRSEPFRKALEASGDIETYGFAGFFGLPIAKVPYAGHEAVPMCPILLEPQYTIQEAPSSSTDDSFVNRQLRQAVVLREQWIYALKKIKRDTFATFSYVESFGLVHALTLLKDSFAGVPFGLIKQKMVNTVAPLLNLKPELSVVERHGQPDLLTGIPFNEQITLAKTILTLMGLRRPFAEFVILCGHVAQTYNNPYASSLDCGACGANGGGFNALVLSRILNRPDIREALATEDIIIPDDTCFIAAEHNTTTDGVAFLNLEAIPSQQQEKFLNIQRSFQHATALNQVKRQKQLKFHSAVSTQSNNPLTISYDWSQTRPEWGLSGNQAFIVGNREVTKTLDLEGRCFLHSYNWVHDPAGDVLTVIMTAPMIVAAWINLQYCFSTLNNNRFGSGKKYTHNIVGLFGTYLGNASDLRLGLPYESLFSNDGTPYHLPQRLLVYIQAPKERVAKIIEAQQAVKNLITNQWITLMVFDPQEKVAYHFQGNDWQVVANGQQCLLSPCSTG